MDFVAILYDDHPETRRPNPPTEKQVLRHPNGTLVCYTHMLELESTHRIVHCAMSISAGLEAEESGLTTFGLLQFLSQDDQEVPSCKSRWLTASPILLRRTVDRLLGSGDRVYRGHQSFLQSERVVDDLSAINHCHIDGERTGKDVVQGRESFLVCAAAVTTGNKWQTNETKAVRHTTVGFLLREKTLKKPYQTALFVS